MKHTFLFIVFILSFKLIAAQSFNIKDHYTKKEVYIPMRDGVRLFTAIYLPKDSTKRYPVLLNRTPYSIAPYGEDQYPPALRPSEHFAKEGYIFVFQDVRGKNKSEGAFIDMTPHQAHKTSQTQVDESSDTYDCIDWVLKNIRNTNGKVGQWGISYPGFYTSAGMINAHPALVASSPQAPICDWFTGDDFRHNGTFLLPHFFGFMWSFGQPRSTPVVSGWKPFTYPTQDGYEFYLNYIGPLKNVRKYYGDTIAFWNQLSKHEQYDDFWKRRNIRPHLKQIKPAVLVVGGWFDAENLYGALQTYQTVESQSPKTQNTLVMGPWIHGGWNKTKGSYLGDISFSSSTSEYYRDSIEFPFFNYYLKGKSGYRPTEATVFETGSNLWKKYDHWPPVSTSKVAYYLHHKKLATDMDSAYTISFDSDPAKPVPYMEKCEVGMTKEYMVADQRFASRRPDVMVFQTEPLQEDITVAGPIPVELFISSTGTDADWIVKIIDVYPDSAGSDSINGRKISLGGYQMLVRGDVMRSKFRNSFSAPEPLQPNVQTRIRFELNDVNHCFRKGHRLMVHVQSSWFPLIDRNPQQFIDVFEAETNDFIISKHRIWGHSNITLNILQK